MRHFMAQFGPCLKWPWTKLTDVPEFNDELVDLIAGQSDEQARPLDPRAGAHPRRQPGRHHAGAGKQHKGKGWGAGALLQRLFDAGAGAGARPRKPIRTPSAGAAGLDRLQRPHERGALPAGLADATDAFMRLIGATPATSPRRPYFTVETHIRHSTRPRRRPISPNPGHRGPASVRSSTLDATAACSHGEHMLIHVSLATRAASEPGPEVAEIAACTRAARPEGLGRAVGQPR